MNVYDYSVKRQQIAPKKIYCIDTGLVNKVGFGFSPNTGKLLENLVYLSLRRSTPDVYYFSAPSGYEVDFYLPANRQLIQVTQNLINASTLEREIRALQSAVQQLKPESAVILTDANGNDMEIDGVPVMVRSAAEWMLRF